MAALPKILLITVRSDNGGGPKLVDALAHALNREARVEIFVASPLDPPYGELFQQNTKAHFALAHRKWSWRTFLKLRKFCRVNQIDLVHAHGFGAGLYARFLGRPVVYQPHGTHAPTGVIGRLKLLIERLLLNFTDEVIYISDSERQQAEALGLNPRFKTVVTNPLLGEPVPRSESAGSPPVFGTLARLDPIKQHLRLIELFRDLAKQGLHPDLRLKIMGDGECRTEIAEAIKADGAPVEILPFSGDAYRFLSGLDLFVSASRSEGFGLAVLEALACGVPCLISRVPGHTEFIERGWAVGFDSSSPESFRAGAEKILTGAFKGPNVVLVKQQYSLAGWVSKITSTYQTVLDRVSK